MSYCVPHYPFTFSNLTIPNKIDQNRVISRMNISKELQQLKLVSNVLLFHLTKSLILLNICAVPINIQSCLINELWINNEPVETYIYTQMAWISKICKHLLRCVKAKFLQFCEYMYHHILSPCYLLTKHIFGTSLHFYKCQFILFC